MSTKTFKFEIQALITVTVEADNKEDARLKVVDNLHDGDYDDAFGSDAYVSDGVEVSV